MAVATTRLNSALVLLSKGNIAANCNRTEASGFNSSAPTFLDSEFTGIRSYVPANWLRLRIAKFRNACSGIPRNCRCAVVSSSLSIISAWQATSSSWSMVTGPSKKFPLSRYLRSTSVSLWLRFAGLPPCEAQTKACPLHPVQRCLPRVLAVVSRRFASHELVLLTRTGPCSVLPPPKCCQRVVEQTTAPAPVRQVLALRATEIHGISWGVLPSLHLDRERGHVPTFRDGSWQADTRKFYRAQRLKARRGCR